MSLLGWLEKKPKFKVGDQCVLDKVYEKWEPQFVVEILDVGVEKYLYKRVDNAYKTADYFRNFEQLYKGVEK